MKKSILRWIAFCIVMLVSVWALISLRAQTGRDNVSFVKAQTGVCGSNGLGFRLSQSYRAGSDPRAITSGDFNKDGLPDLAVADIGNRSQANVAILLGNGQGEFVNAFNLQLQSNTSFSERDVQARDLNNDGADDLVIAGAFNSASSLGVPVVVVALSQGNGAFAAPVFYSVSSRTAVLALADFNNDGRTDIAVLTPDKVFTLNGRGDGTFADAVAVALPPLPFGSSGTPLAMVAADFNRDEHPDLVILSGPIPSVVLLLSKASGGFDSTSPASVQTNNRAYVSAGDFTGDGNSDLILGSSVYPGDGTGKFGTAIPLPTIITDNVLLTDLNQDNKADLAIFGGNILTTAFGNGNGAISSANPYALNDGISSSFPNYLGRRLVAGDFNKDGNIDIAALGSRVNVLLGAGENNFQAARYLSSFNRTLPVDLNQDRRPDLILWGGVSSGFAVRLSNANGDFDAQVSYQSVNSISSVTVGDFNKDAAPDLVLISDSSGIDGTQIVIVPGRGRGDFNVAAAVTLRAGTQSSSSVAADFNKDGNPDLAVANAGSNDVSLFIGNGRNQFASPVTISAGLEPVMIVSADFNADNNPDLVTANRNSAGLTLMMGNGNGTFNYMPLGIGANPGSVHVSDVNRDGKPDIVVPHNYSRLVTTLLNSGNGNFGSPIVSDVGQIPLPSTIDDLTGDGKPDLIVTGYPQQTDSSVQNIDFILNNGVRVFAGDGSGKFIPAFGFAFPNSAQLFVGDFNGDNLPDVGAATPSGIVVARSSCNSSQAGKAVIVSAASYQGLAMAPETIASIFGSNLSAETRSAPALPLPTELGGTMIKIRDSQGQERTAPLFFVSPNQINCLIPTGLAPGLATVTIISGSNTSTGIVMITSVAPGIFTANADGQGVPAALALRIKPGGQQTYESVAVFDSNSGRFIPRLLTYGISPPAPSSDQLFLILFGTGLRGQSNVTATLGGQPVNVAYAGPQGDLAGLDQVNIALPTSFFGQRELQVQVFVNGVRTNPVQIALQ